MEKQFLSRLQLLIPTLLAAAQKVYDEWEQDEEGIDPELGAGGPCDQISQAFGDVLAENGIDSLEGSQDGDDHSFLIAYDGETKSAATINLPAHCYERGGGYTWKKIPGVTFQPEDLQIYSTEFQPDFLTL